MNTPQSNNITHQNAIKTTYDIADAYRLAIEEGFALLDASIDENALKNHLRHESCGAIATFEGLVRNHNNQQTVEKLTYYAYEKLALNQGKKIISEAKQKFDIHQAIAIHRIGALAIGDMAVWIGVASSHRHQAFEACRWILDAIKADVPIWKQEYYPHQSSQWLSNNG